MLYVKDRLTPFESPHPGPTIVLNRTWLHAARLAALACGIGCWLSPVASAHPLVENAIDVVVAPDRITIDARIANEAIVLVEGDKQRISTDAEWRAAVERHADYVRQHIHVVVDGHELTGSAAFNSQPAAGDHSGVAPADGLMIPYRLTYVLSTPPHQVEVSQDFLREFPEWSAPCALRMRRVDQTEFDLSLLKRGGVGKLECDWPAAAAPAAAGSIQTDVKPWPTFRAYMLHGVVHILTGYDHLLFATALVLAATQFWDLVKVVTAFTVAHSLTLTLSVFNVVTLSDRIVEPMIAVSIIFVAVQNIFWPEKSTGWARLAIAFSFGLFHGLGFAGGLKESLADMPSIALWLALIAFSLGVEIGHQIVIIPLYTLLRGARTWGTEQPRQLLQSRILKFGSAAIALAGIYFLVEAVRG